MLRRSICALLLAAPLSMTLAGCTSFGMKQNLAARRLESATTSHTARLMNLAARYEQQGNHEGALRLYRQVIQAEPNNRAAQEKIAALDSRRQNGVLPDRQTMVAEAATTSETNASPGEALEPAPAPPLEAGIEVAEAAPIQDPAPFPEATDVVITPDPAFAEPAPATDESEVFEPPVFAVATSTAAPELSAEWWNSDPDADEFESPFEEASPDVDELPTDWSRTSVARLCEGAAPELLAVVQELDSSNPSDRKEALVGLARRGTAAEAALPAMEALLSDPDVLVQAHAAWAIWEVSHNPEDSIDALLALLVEDSNPEVTQISSYLLGAIGPDAAVAENALWYTCDRTSGVTRLHAAEALMRIMPADQRPVTILIEALSDAQPETRCLAALMLSSTSPGHRTEVVEALTAALDDSESEVCAAAALSLGGFGEQASVAESGLQAAAASENDDVRSAARMALDCIVQ